MASVQILTVLLQSQSKYWQYNYGLSKYWQYYYSLNLITDSISMASVKIMTVLLQPQSKYWQYYYSLHHTTDGTVLLQPVSLLTVLLVEPQSDCRQYHYSLSLTLTVLLYPQSQYWWYYYSLHHTTDGTVLLQPISLLTPLLLWDNTQPALPCRMLLNGSAYMPSSAFLLVVLESFTAKWTMANSGTFREKFISWFHFGLKPESKIQPQLNTTNILHNSVINLLIHEWLPPSLPFEPRCTNLTLNDSNQISAITVEPKHTLNI